MKKSEIGPKGCSLVNGASLHLKGQASLSHPCRRLATQTGGEKTEKLETDWGGKGKENQGLGPKLTNFRAQIQRSERLDREVRIHFANYLHTIAFWQVGFLLITEAWLVTWTKESMIAVLVHLLAVTTSGPVTTDRRPEIRREGAAGKDEG